MSEPGHGKTVILVVDDSKVSRSLSVGMLQKRRPEAEIHEAGDGATAVASALGLAPQLVLMDVNMPGISGLDAAAQILAARPGTRIAILTANYQEATQRRAAELGLALFRKPAKGEVMDQIVDLLGVPA